MNLGMMMKMMVADVEDELGMMVMVKMTMMIMMTGYLM